MGLAHSNQAPTSVEQESLLGVHCDAAPISSASEGCDLAVTTVHEITTDACSSIGEVLKTYAHHLWIVVVLSILILVQIILIYEESNVNANFLSNLTYFATLTLSLSACGLVAVCVCFLWKSRIIQELTVLLKASCDGRQPDEQLMFLAKETRIWVKLGFWAGLREFADLFPWLASLSFVGHVSTMDLAALSLVEVFIYTLMDLTWWAVSMTESVLVSQAHGSRCLLTMRGWAMMSFVVITICNFALTLLCVACKETLLTFGFDAIIAERGATYARFIIPAFYAEGATICIATYLTAFQEAVLPAYIQLIAGLLHLLVTYILIFGIGSFQGMDDALKASALGWIISSSISCCLEGYAMHQLWGKELNYAEIDDPDGDIVQDQLIIFENQETGKSTEVTVKVPNMTLFTSDPHFDVRGRKSTKLHVKSPLLPKEFEYRVLDDGSNSSRLGMNFPWVCSWVLNRRRWLKYSKQALPNFATTGMQTLSMFVMSMFAAKLGPFQIAAHNSSVALFEVLYTVVQGMGEGTSIRIGFHVGKGDVYAAKVVMWISLVVSLLWGIFAAGAGYLFRYDLAGFLSNDPEVQALFVSLAPLVWGSYAVFSVGGQCLAVLDGQGRAPAQAVSFLIGSWLTSVPLFIYSSFRTDWGLRGLWAALVIGYMVTLGVAALYIQYSNWNDIIDCAKERVAGEGTQEIENKSKEENCTDSDDILPTALVAKEISKLVQSKPLLLEHNK